jgi:hypothetical protein
LISLWALNGQLSPPLNAFVVVPSRSYSTSPWDVDCREHQPGSIDAGAECVNEENGDRNLSNDPHVPSW